jgi:(p)ppGpp synthase/HD superfamily hydrolase
MSTLERAIAIAAEAHAGAVDKAGKPYILHPIRVMLQMATNDERIVAVLHDVVEDCKAWTLDRLRAEGFSDEVVRGVDAVTKREGETYEAFVLRGSADPLGKRVKLADLRDNLNLSRIAEPSAKDHERIAKYQRALASLEGGSA